LFFRLAQKSAFFYAAAWLPAQGMRGAVGARSCGRERQNPLFSAVEAMPLIDKMGLFAYEKEGENTEKQVENCGDLW
jgi:hypothetical protein